MNELKFTIIIPTKNRADTLYWALKTCVEQRYGNLDIIVSDNFSKDNTKEIVLSFNDPRIKYINTGEPLSMSGNWEFALSNVQEGFISFLGDDDAFLPNAITTLNEIACETQCDAINGPSIEYAWPNHLRTFQKNKLLFSKDIFDRQPDVKTMLLKVLHSELHYSVLPWLYKGFVSIKLIKEIKKITNEFFHSKNPDIYSAVAISSKIEEHKYYYTPVAFAINGASSHSNGVSQQGKFKNAGALEFLSEISIPFHNTLVSCNSIPVYVYECYLQAKDAGLIKDEYPVTLDMVLESAIAAMQYRDKESYQSIKKAVLDTGAKNNLNMDKLNSMIEKYPNRTGLSRVANKFRNRYFSPSEQIDMNEYKVKNVYDAADIAYKILNKEITPGATKSIQTISRDIKAIFQTN